MNLRIASTLEFMIKEFFMRKMLSSQLRDVPEADREKLFQALQEHPELFQNIAKEVEAGMKAGKDKMAVTMEIVQKYEKELSQVFKK